MRFTHSIRDPIHGMVPVTDCEWELLRSAAFGRMRGVRQMGMASISYPGAHHTRFEHMVGAMHVSWLLCADLDFLSDRDKYLIRLATLCHDLGHWPYSHSLEDAARRHASQPGLGFLRRFLDHESRTYYLLMQDVEIGEIIARHPDYADIGRQELAQLAVGKHPRRDLNLFTHSEIDADRIDYVMRDNFYCGFTHGVDAEALRDLYVLDPEYGLVINSARTYVASQLLAARYHLITNIQNDPFSRLGDLLLAESIREALAAGDADRQQAFEAALDAGQDTDLEHFLKQHGPQHWAQLQALATSQTSYELLASYDFSDLSPLSRFAIQSVQIRQGNIAQLLQDRLERETGVDFLIDLVRIKPPTDPLRYSRNSRMPWHGRLTELPLVQGIVNESLVALTLHVYRPAAELCEVPDDRWHDWTEQYRLLDPTFDEHKASRFLQDYWNGDRVSMAFLMALEGSSFDLLLTQLGTHPSRLDILFLVSYLALSLVEDALGEHRLYLDGRESLWALLRHPAIRPCMGGRLPRAYSSPEMSGVFLNDLAFLQASGLLYGPSRVERVRNSFVNRPKFGMTGWGRSLMRAMLSAEPGLQFATQLRETMLAFFEPTFDVYQEYFSLLASETPADAARRRELRRQMPVPFTR